MNSINRQGRLTRISVCAAANRLGAAERYVLRVPALQEAAAASRDVPGLLEGEIRVIDVVEDATLAADTWTLETLPP